MAVCQIGHLAVFSNTNLFKTTPIPNKLLCLTISHESRASYAFKACASQLTLQKGQRFYAMRPLIIVAFLLLIWGVGVVEIVFKCPHRKVILQEVLVSIARKDCGRQLPKKRNRSQQDVLCSTFIPLPEAPPQTSKKRGTCSAPFSCCVNCPQSKWHSIGDSESRIGRF